MLNRSNSRETAYSERPPTYRTTPDAPPPFPADSPVPSSFTVGTSKVSFVSVEQVRGHLLLLAAFRRLKLEVEAADVKIPPEARFPVFVAMAVHRFELYLDKVVQGGTRQGCRPPMDVAIVWHTLQLNPAVRPFPFLLFSSVVDPESLSSFL
jgi:hypothetical protein